jgi:hypothetical protein
MKQMSPRQRTKMKPFDVTDEERALIEILRERLPDR